MDNRSKTALVATVTLVAAAVSGLAWAQRAEPADHDPRNAAPAAGAAPATQTNVFGAQSLPKGLTIVPWKKGSVTDLTSGPTGLVEEPLGTVDGDDFQRRLEAYQRAQGRN